LGKIPAAAADSKVADGAVEDGKVAALARCDAAATAITSAERRVKAIIVYLCV